MKRNAADGLFTKPYRRAAASKERHMFGLGWMELVIILVIVLILFGAGKLPEIGTSLGKGIKNFKKATKGEDEIDVTPEKEKKIETESKQ